jgi:hypothetical protein
MDVDGICSYYNELQAYSRAPGSFGTIHSSMKKQFTGQNGKTPSSDVFIIVVNPFQRVTLRAFF